MRDRKELTIDATIENVAAVTAFVDEQLEQLNCPAKTQVQVDIAIDENKNLVIGVGVGRYYVAQMDIPATEYKEVEVEKEETAAMIADDDNGEITEETQTAVKTQLVAQPLNMAKVVLTLWGMDDLKAIN